MSITFTGVHRPIGRAITGFHSVDWAMRGSLERIGWPTRTYAEIYGPTGIGKTTFAVSILGIIAGIVKAQGIACMSTENQDINMIENALKWSKFDGEWKWINGIMSKGKLDNSDETLLGLLEDALYEEPPFLGLLDTIASISPVAERKGKIGDANMGKRAFPMAQFSRGVQRALRDIEAPVVVFATNHQYEDMQTVGGAKVYIEPGGKVKKNIMHVRIQMKVPWVDYISGGEGKKEARWDDAWVLQGRADKNRAGGLKRTFQTVVIGGQGLHAGLSSIIDCLALELAEVKSGGMVTLDGQPMGKINSIMAHERDNKELFTPFQNKLKAWVLNGGQEDEIEEADEDEEEVKPKKSKKK